LDLLSLSDADIVTLSYNDHLVVKPFQLLKRNKIKILKARHQHLLYSIKTPIRLL